MGFEQGDPGDKDPVFYDPDYVSELLSTATIQFQIPDPIPDFPTTLVNTANDFVGKDRWKNEREITAMLSLFGCPFKHPQTGKYQADRVKTRPTAEPFQILGEFWSILSDRRFADRTKPLGTSPFSGQTRVQKATVFSCFSISTSSPSMTDFFTAQSA